MNNYLNLVVFLTLMKIGALVSGGKDGLFAAYKASKGNELVCLIAIKSKNDESYMFHIPNIELVKIQAEAMEIPLVFWETEGIKEEELSDLKDAIAIAKEKYKIEGITSGAIASSYQKERVDKICNELKIESIAPLWQINSELYLTELMRDFEVIITGIAAEGLSKEDLGKRWDLSFVEKLKKNKLSLVGEGGEAESLVVNCPLFKRRIDVKEASAVMENEITGHYVITSTLLV